MKKVSFVFALVILFTTWVPARAQTGPTGTWQVEGGPRRPWTLSLKENGTKLTGEVNDCGAPRVEIAEGSIDGDTIRFECRRPDGSLTIALAGRISGDEIEFKWKKLGPGIVDPVRSWLFGASASPQFIAKRVPDANVRGLEFAAAVNVPQNDVKVVGTLFLPARVSRMRTVIVVPDWGLGRAFYFDPQVGRFLEATESVVLLVRVSQIQTTRTENQQTSVTARGAEGLLLLLQSFARESGHPELAAAPLLFWGHSAAGGFGPSFAALHPQRTIAFVRYHSGGGQMPGDPRVLSQIPALFLKGGKDTQAAGDSEALWRSGRSTGGPWAFSLDPDADHGSEESLRKANDLLIPWMTGVIRQRLSPDGITLQPVTDGSAWLGNNQSGEFAPYGTFTGSKPEASWLPDETSARGWQEVMGKAK